MALWMACPKSSSFGSFLSKDVKVITAIDMSLTTVLFFKLNRKNIHFVTCFTSVRVWLPLNKFCYRKQMMILSSVLDSGGSARHLFLFFMFSFFVVCFGQVKNFKQAKTFLR